MSAALDAPRKRKDIVNYTPGDVSSVHCIALDCVVRNIVESVVKKICGPSNPIAETVHQLIIAKAVEQLGARMLPLTVQLRTANIPTNFEMPEFQVFTGVENPKGHLETIGDTQYYTSNRGRKECPRREVYSLDTLDSPLRPNIVFTEEDLVGISCLMTTHW